MRNGGFNVIVGNPPYIRIQNMVKYSPEEVNCYKAEGSPYRSARQDNFDKYALFIERAISLLQPEGRLGFIVPHKFMTILSGRPLRRLITDRRLLDEVVHFGAKQVFGPETSNYTCILVLDLRARDSFRFERAGPLEGWRYGQPGAVSVILASEVTEDPWQFADAETQVLFGRVRVQDVSRLDTLAEIFVGVQTSADDIYIFSPSGETTTTFLLRWNDQDWPIERDILRPSLHDVPLVPYGRPLPNSWMIFPYDLILEGDQRRARLIQPAELQRRFPNCWEYLNARRVELEQRDIQGGPAAERQWYAFGRTQSLIKFDSPKIILPILSLEPRYAYDETNIVVTGGGNGPYYMIRQRPGTPVTNLYLLAVLNHPFSEALVRTNTSTFRGGYYSHGKQFIKALPVPNVSNDQRREIERRVATLIDMIERTERALTPRERDPLERQIIQLNSEVVDLVSRAFALTDADLATVRSVPIPE